MVIINPKKAKQKFKEHLGEIKELQKMDYKKRKDGIGKLNSKIRSLINVAFDDGKEKLSNYKPTPFYVVSTGMSAAEKEENSRDYSDNLLRNMENFVIGYYEELDLTIDTSEKKDELSKIEGKIKKANLESDRRESVVKSKFFGAVMEMLDFQRNELKDRGETAKEIYEIKMHLQKIEDMLSQVLSQKKPKKV